MVYAFFFGLILASVYFVGKRVKRWGAIPVIALLAGTAVAVTVALLTPATENDSFVYLMLCGVVAMASMIVPGLSGSFVLLLMGNYSLIMIDSVNKLTSGDMSAMKILIPVGIGAVVGLIALSHLLAWIFKNYHDTAVALLTGFVAGSLLVIWPWKNEQTVTFEKGGETKTETIGYEWFLPDMSPGTWLAIGLIVAGILAVWVMEIFGAVPTGEDDQVVK
jgi:putative membrane protein